MKRLLTAFALATFLLSTSCAFETQYGECIGFDDDPDPTLVYEVSTRNVIWTVLGSESVVPIVVWALECVKCPVGHR